MSDNLERSVKELKHSIDRLNNRIDRWWKIVLYGIFQGAGAVIGAVLIALIVSTILDAVGFFSAFHDSAEDIRATLRDLSGRE